MTTCTVIHKIAVNIWQKSLSRSLIRSVEINLTNFKTDWNSMQYYLELLPLETMFKVSLNRNSECCCTDQSKRKISRVKSSFQLSPGMEEGSGSQVLTGRCLVPRITLPIGKRSASGLTESDGKGNARHSAVQVRNFLSNVGGLQRSRR